MMQKLTWKWSAALVLMAGLAGCGSGGDAGNTSASGGDSGGAMAGNTSGGAMAGGDMAGLTGTIQADGSSTVGPITTAMAETFRTQAKQVRVQVGTSGTGGGFKKFAGGTTDISDASRPIKDKEAAAAKAKGIEFIELPVAYDGIAIVVNTKNTWAKNLTTAELKKIWDKGSKINNWSQVRPGFPARKLTLYGPGTASGTFDYFTEEINGKTGQSRSDYTASEDDNVLVEGVSRDAGALGYFGHGYYEENKDKLSAASINGVTATAETIRNGKYKPLSRPLFIYVKKSSADKPEVKAFINYYLEQAPTAVSSVGFVPLPDAVYTASKARFAAGTTGSVYAAKDAKGKTLEQLFKS